ncbi:hypothetical protein G6F68_016249 [Rhizopus microsporus]|nr:hypothetical protein G6F68_016249 [Rhizopus microsporus]
MSFDEISTFYQQICRVKDRDYFPMVLVGNKCDLESDRQVSSQEGKDLAKQFGCQFIETSAKQKINVEEAFFEVVKDIRRYNKEQENRGNNNNNDPFVLQENQEVAADKCCILM